ncbi:helix-turn-helix domain-containing protein [Novacetimonas cocois]|uniref:Fis family transcriptional regulator n=1 Tax=Novacetimonas cocois TaxID=1747507 RepID=A0A365YY48_9PROT|nr:helix-turn-helix domain-containing protein [Novacetimonas cocois]RBM08289.1 Fis family transcriptional regulator [Novacetimonas cocois]
MIPTCDRHAEPVPPVPALRPASTTEVTKSWQRCVASYGLDPSQGWKADVLSGAEFRHVSGCSAELLKVAMPEMRRLFSLVQGLGLMVLLADRDAIILARNIDEAHQPVCRRLELREGAIWSEHVAGTNGIGTSVQDCCPIVLGEGEHWRFCFSLLASYAVPVFDAQGQVAGAINLAAFSGNSTRPVAPLVLDALMQSGRRIEEQLFRACYAGGRVLTLGTAEGCSAPLVSVNDEGEIIGATHAARSLTGWTDDMIQMRPNLLNKLESGDEISFHKAEENVIRSALALSHGNASATARSLGISRATLYRKMKGLGIR